MAEFIVNEIKAVKPLEVIDLKEPETCSKASQYHFDWIFAMYNAECEYGDMVIEAASFDEAYEEFRKNKCQELFDPRRGYIARLHVAKAY